MPHSIVGQRYRLMRPIGEGGMGAVWAAVHMQTDREVALKLVRRDAAMDTSVRERMLREARACGRVAHRNVVEILDAGITETGDPFLVMPLLRGETLAERLTRDHRLPWPVVARLAADVAKGLAAVHAAGIVHRDLKPGNVFLAYETDVEEPVVKLLDFGVSKMLDRFESSVLTRTGGVVGSPAYMSPEQVHGDQAIDHRSDLWSLGVILFEMATGTFPFRGDNAYALVAEILHAKVPLVSEHAPSVDARLVRLVSKCLERDVHTRIGSAIEVAEALEQLLASAPPLADRNEPFTTMPLLDVRQVLATGEPSLEFARHAPRTVRRRRGLVAGVLVGMFTIGAVATFFAVAREHRSSMRATPDATNQQMAASSGQPSASMPLATEAASVAAPAVTVSAATSASQIPARRPRSSSAPSSRAPRKAPSSGIKFPDDPG